MARVPFRGNYPYKPPSKYIFENVNVFYEQSDVANRREATHDVNTEAELILSNNIRFMANMKFKGATTGAATTRNVLTRFFPGKIGGFAD